MQPLSGPSSPVGNNRAQPNDPVPAGNVDKQPLSPAQRTTLEKLIVKLIALTPMKSPEIWANLRHDLGLPHDAELTSSQFPQAENLLQGKLTQAQSSHATRQLLQQLTELLPQGNNRQAVSDFIRQNFGHTVLSQLSHEQLQQVLVLIQSHEMSIPQPQQTPVTDRTLLPAEHNSLQQFVTKLSAATGEAPAKLWHALFDLVGLKSGDPIPAKHFQLLSQFLQVKIAVNQQTAPTLTSLLGALKQPASSEEVQQLSQHAQTQFSATLTTPLTQYQVNKMISLLFRQRVERMPHEHDEFTVTSRTVPQPIVNPLVAMLPASMQAMGGKPLIAIIFIVVILLLWAVL